MRSKEEIKEKIENLDDKIAGIKAENPENLTNELKVILAGSELQSIILASSLENTEEQTRFLLEKFQERAEELNLNYENASLKNDIETKNKIHAMIWTNDIRMDSLKWILEEEDIGI